MFDPKFYVIRVEYRVTERFIGFDDTRTVKTGVVVHAESEQAAVEKMRNHFEGMSHDYGTRYEIVDYDVYKHLA